MQKRLCHQRHGRRQAQRLQGQHAAANPQPGQHHAVQGAVQGGVQDILGHGPLRHKGGAHAAAACDHRRALGALRPTFAPQRGQPHLVSIITLSLHLSKQN